MNDPIWTLRVRPARVLIGVLLVIAALLLIARELRDRWGSWLIETDPPAQGEVAIVLAGGEGERLGAAVQIWRARRVSALLITGPDVPLLPVYTGEDSLTMGEVKRRIAVRRGVPDSSVWVSLGPTSTLEEAIRAREVLEERRVRRAVVVTSPFHSRRARRTFLMAFRGSGIDLSTETLPVGKSQDNPRRWWTREHDLLAVFTETVKLLHYWRRYGVRPF